mgnify:CR=1 FL=1
MKTVSLPEKQLKYFGTIADRADRLMGRTGYLLEYAQQVRDTYQAQVDAVQNKNMSVLTCHLTIFFADIDYRLVWDEFSEYAGIRARISGCDPAEPDRGSCMYHLL